MTDTSEQQDLIPMLKRVSLFSRCTDGECQLIARNSEMRTIEPGEKIIAQGEEGSEMFILLDGSADAAIEGAVQHTFGPGDYFGELAALAPAARTSDVVATSVARVAVVSRENVFRLIDTVPGVAAKMLESLAISLREHIGAG